VFSMGKRLPADVMLAAYLHYRVCRLRLTQYTQDLLFIVSLITHNQTPATGQILNLHLA
jgi:hypothetical protein